MLDINAANELNERLTYIVDIFRNHAEGWRDADLITWSWRISKDELVLELESVEMVNKSCSCHPEYRLERHTLERRFALEEITGKWPAEMYEWHEVPLISRLWAEK